MPLILLCSDVIVDNCNRVLQGHWKYPMEAQMPVETQNKNMQYSFIGLNLRFSTHMQNLLEICP